ncbi:MAG: hypothetical protein ACRC1K_09480, partial [Planctomycetia bacterium]
MAATHALSLKLRRTYMTLGVLLGAVGLLAAVSGPLDGIDVHAEPVSPFAAAPNVEPPAVAAAVPAAPVAVPAPNAGGKIPTPPLPPPLIARNDVSFHGGVGKLPSYAPSPDDAAYPLPPELVDVQLNKQTDAEIALKSDGCVNCHKNAHDPHYKTTVRLGCTDCHGGDATCNDIFKAHIHPVNPEAWTSSANPVRSYALLNHESPDFIRFMNPGDLRVAHISCGTAGCHAELVYNTRKSMMTHGCMLWGAALYNNGAINHKRAKYGESYSMHGVPQRVQTVPPPTPEEMEKKGVVPYLEPLPRFEMS